MKHLFFLLLSLLFYVCASQTQTGFSCDVKAGQLPLAKVINFAEMQQQPDWEPNLITVGIAHDEFFEGPDKTELTKKKLEFIRNNAGKKTIPQIKTLNTAAQPVLGTNFQGQSADNVPNDNHMAISNGGKIVSVYNNRIRVFSSTGTQLSQKTLASFASSLGTFSFTSDPRVVYDPQADRFIVTFFSGSSSTTSKIIVAFSQSNDPVASWNFYQLSGNYLNDSTWSDYPIVALSNTDFFVTFNQLKDGAGDWRTAFRYSIIWQIDKNDGYNGNTLNFNYWSNIKYNNKFIWNVCPVQGGSSPAGPETYFVSVRNYDFANDTVFLHTISDSKISGNAAFSSKVLKTNLQYGIPPNARQKNGQWLSTNDARILSAIVENNKIQYVQNTLDPVNFNSGIFHGSIDNPSSPTPVATAKIISSDTMNFGYPSIAYMGSGPADNSVMITCSYLPDSGYAGTGLHYKDNNGNYANMLKVKAGTNFMTYVKTFWGDTLERWGDYSGIQRMYNAPNSAWLSGSWGKNPGATYATWIAKVIRTDTVLISVPEKNTVVNDVSVYPNPTIELVNVEFELKETEMLDFSVFDVQGKLITILLRDKIKAGKQKFSFNTAPLTKGIYFLKICDDKNVVVNKKIVVQ